MSKQWQIRRGTTIENDSFTGAIGELTMDTDKNQLRIHDGVKQGGHIFGDTVIEFQAPTADNNYTWYRLYASGWVEQGGYLSSRSSTGRVTVTFPIEMAEPPKICSQMMYNIPSSDTGNVTWQSANFTDVTTTSLKIMGHTTIDKSWEVKGMAA